MLRLRIRSLPNHAATADAAPTMITIFQSIRLLARVLLAQMLMARLLMARLLLARVRLVRLQLQHLSHGVIPN